MPEFKLPTLAEARTSFKAGQASALQMFIVENQPTKEFGRDVWRERLGDVIDEAIYTASPDLENISPRPWYWLRDEGQFIVDVNGNIVAEIPCTKGNPIDGEFIVKAANSYTLEKETMPDEANEPLKKSDFFAMMEENYKRRAKAEKWKTSELAATLATMDERLSGLWRKTRKAQLTKADIEKILTPKPNLKLVK